MIFALFGSSPLVGSSKNSTFGLCIKDLIKLSLDFIPFENAETFLSACSRSPTESKSSSIPLFSPLYNAAKYAMENTRVYVDLTQDNNRAIFTIKNISKNEIKVEGGDYNNLTERFVRGEISRTTEGSGLGLSIAKNLTILMGGTFEIKVDGDLFIAQLSFEMI